MTAIYRKRTIVFNLFGNINLVLNSSISVIMNKSILCVGLFLCSLSLLAAHDQVVEIDVKGLTCSFCVYGLQDNLEKHTDVEQAEISLKQSKVRIHLIPNATITVEELNEIIEDAGFEPGEFQHYDQAEHPCDIAAC